MKPGQVVVESFYTIRAIRQQRKKKAQKEVH